MIRPKYDSMITGLSILPQNCKVHKIDNPFYFFYLLILENYAGFLTLPSFVSLSKPLAALYLAAQRCLLPDFFTLINKGEYELIG